MARRACSEPKLSRTRSEVQLSIPAEARVARAATARKCRGELDAEKREHRITNADFDDLFESEKRERILREQNHQCSECKTGLIWNGKPLKLELDHINGDRTNESRSNLRIICPNCHQQTPTYKRKNVKRVYTDAEIKEAI